MLLEGLTYTLQSWLSSLATHILFVMLYLVVKHNQPSEFTFTSIYCLQKFVWFFLILQCIAPVHTSTGAQWLILYHYVLTIRKFGTVWEPAAINISGPIGFYSLQMATRCCAFICNDGHSLVCMKPYTIGKLSSRATNFMNSAKRKFMEIIFTNDISGAHCHSLQYTWTSAAYMPSCAKRYKTH